MRRFHDGAWISGNARYLILVRNAPAVGPQPFDSGPCCLRHTIPSAMPLVQIPKIGISHDGVILDGWAMFQNLTPGQREMLEKAKEAFRDMIRKMGMDPDDFQIL